MNTKNEIALNSLLDIGKILNELKFLISKYNKFFNIAEIFSSENGGKTRLNRQVFNENHEDIQSSILKISLCLDESLTILKNKLTKSKVTKEPKRLNPINSKSNRISFCKNVFSCILINQLKAYISSINKCHIFI